MVYLKCMQIDIERYQSLLTKKGATSERAALVEQILEEVNKERLGTKFKPMTGRVLAIKLSHLSTSDIYYTHSMAKDYKARKGSYSKYLFGSIKVK